MSQTDRSDTDAGIGTLLTVAGWTGGGVVSGLIFQVMQSPVTEGPFPTAHPTDAFLAVVAGSFLVGPLVVAALLWHWGQPRVVGTVAGLCLAGVVAAVPLIAFVGGAIDGGAVTTGIVGFVGMWGIVLPVGVRTLVVGAGAGDTVVDRVWRWAGGASPTPAVASEGGDGSPWQAMVPATATAIPWGASWLDQHAVAPHEVAPVPGPPIDPSLPPIVLPPEVRDQGR